MEETTAEFSREELGVQVPLKRTPKITVGCKTDLGRVRENNEDKFEYYVPESEGLLASRGSVFLVCDGMGGHAAGQIASELTCKTFIDVYLHHGAENAADAAREAVRAANRFVLDVGRSVPSRRGMGTTLSGLILLQDAFMTVQVGDSRIYGLRAGELRRLTRDHTFIEEQVAAGVLSVEEAAAHPYAHVLTRAIGVDDGVEPDIETDELQPDDTFLLCSDGLTNHVSDSQIEEMLRLSPSEAAWRLVGSALVDGGSDNCTALVVRVDGFIDHERLGAHSPNRS